MKVDARVLQLTIEEHYKPRIKFSSISELSQQLGAGSKDMQEVQQAYEQYCRIMNNVNTKNPPLSTTEYEIILCIKCYSDGNFPIILSSNDFNKVTIQERLVEGRSKKRKSEPPELQPEPEWSQD